jgi:hypothetical protein
LKVERKKEKGKRKKEKGKRKKEKGKRKQLTTAAQRTQRREEFSVSCLTSPPTPLHFWDLSVCRESAHGEGLNASSKFIVPSSR